MAWLTPPPPQQKTREKEGGSVKSQKINLKKNGLPRPPGGGVNNSGLTPIPFIPPPPALIFQYATENLGSNPAPGKIWRDPDPQHLIIYTILFMFIYDIIITRLVGEYNVIIFGKKTGT